jgi:catechol 2,3-dioxygenase
MFTAPLDLVDLAGATAEVTEGAPGLDIGHVHLRVADTSRAEEFWTARIGMELMTRFGADAIFLATGGYHHQIGANSWQSRGAGREPLHGPGLERLAISADPGIADAVTPDGIPIEITA